MRLSPLLPAGLSVLALAVQAELLTKRAVNQCPVQTITLPKLDYGYNDLEPAIKGQIMEIHHSKHHQAYVDNYNAAEATMAKAVVEGDIVKQLDTQRALNFNGGGHINHALFWKILAPSTSKDVKFDANSQVGKCIIKDFGSLDNLMTEVNKTGAGFQGSGWIWIGYNLVAKRLEIMTTKDQDTLLTLKPIIGIDMWEHAYYLQYYQKRLDYLKAVWTVINFTEADRRFVALQQPTPPVLKP